MNIPIHLSYLHVANVIKRTGCHYSDLTPLTTVSNIPLLTMIHKDVTLFNYLHGSLGKGNTKYNNVVVTSSSPETWIASFSCLTSTLTSIRTLLSLFWEFKREQVSRGGLECPNIWSVNHQSDVQRLPQLHTGFPACRGRWMTEYMKLWVHGHTDDEVKWMILR